MSFSSIRMSVAWVVDPCGELDLASAPGLRDEVLRRLGQGDVVLDLAGVTFFDSAGLHALMASDRRATLLGRRFVVAGASPMVLTVLRVTQVLDRLDIYPSRADALRALEPPPSASPPAPQHCERDRAGAVSGPTA